MAFIRVTALLAKMRALIEGDTTIARDMAANALAEAPPQLSDAEASTRALVAPTYDVALIDAPEPHPANPPHLSALTLYNIRLAVDVTRHMSLIHALDDDARDSVGALAARDGDVLAQALGYPGNLSNDVSSVALGLVSGRLQYESSDVDDVKTEADKTMLVRTRHVFTGVMHANRS